MKMKHLFFYDEEGTGGGQEGAIVQDASQDVAHAADSLKDAANVADSDKSAAMYESIHAELKNIHAELKRSNDRSEKQASTIQAVTTPVEKAPEKTEVEIEAVPQRAIRRGRRKVKK